MTARGDDLADLCASAARVRDAGLEAAGRRGADRPAAGQLLAQGVHPGHAPVPRHLPLLHVRHRAGQAARPGRWACTWSPTRSSTSPAAVPNWVARKRLFTLGDRPEARWDEARQWLDERGYDSTLDYVRAMAIRVLEETGLLPHLNPGVMSWSELSRLKPVAPSMGMMLETTSRRLFETKGLAHYGSPDKDPAVRLRTLDDAGRLSIPFTTGLLVGIGETLVERAETIHAIRRSHKEFGHVQEVIVQNFRAKDHTAMAALPDTGIDDFVATIAVTRLVHGAQDAHPGAAEPGVARRVPGADRRGCRRLGRRVAADPGPRQPGAAVACAGRAGRRHRRGRLRPGAAADRAAAVRAGRCGVDRPAGARRTSTRWPTRRPASRWTSIRSGGRGRSPTRPPSRWAAPTCTPPSTPRAGSPRPAATSAARSATGSRSARRWTSWPPGRPSASTPTCWRRCARPSATRPAAATTSTWHWRPPTVRLWMPLRRWRIRCAATSSATT